MPVIRKSITLSNITDLVDLTLTKDKITDLPDLSLTDLSDVTIDNPTEGNFLKYQSGVWVNASNE